MKIPFFPYAALFSEQEPDLVKIFQDIGRRGAFINQRELHEFENELAKYCGCRHAVGIADGTDAMIIALMAGGIGPGDEVIVCSHTMVATAAAVAFVGAKPVLVDSGPDRLMDPASFEAAITSRTKAVMPTQLNGRVADMESICSIAERHGLKLFEDAAQALGAKYKGRCAGTFGVAGTISFYPSKTLGCFGDGGAILTNDPEVYRQVLLLRDHGRNADGEVERWGFNSRLDNLQAAILLYRFKSYSQVIERRRQVARLYCQLLGGISEVSLPPGPDDSPERHDIFQNFEIEAENRDELRAYLAEKGIGTIIQWGGKAVHQWKGLGYDISLPHVESFFQRCLLLPMNTAITDDEVRYITGTIEEFYGGR
jgi:dTDP-4-amino-4,6-dideoxygalactose transaminase